MAPAAFDPVGIAHLPNQRHKIVSKRGAKFTIMVCGESGLGKTTFVNTLFETGIKEPKNMNRRHQKLIDKTIDIDIQRADLEENGFQVKLTVIDTPGFGDYVNNRDSWHPIVRFIDDLHDSYMKQEQQPVRREITDPRVHACLYFIRPTGHTLSPLDIQAMKEIGTRVNLIPVIAKADTLTPNDLMRFKYRIRDVIHAQGIQVYGCPIESDDEEEQRLNEGIEDAMPFAIIGSSENITTPDGRQVKGRQYTWGVAEVENEEHCDFKKLRTLIIRSHMHDLISKTEEFQYETYRSKQLESPGEHRPYMYESRKLKHQEDSLRAKFTSEVQREEERFRSWEQELIKKRDEMNKDLETTHKDIRGLEEELNQLQARATAKR